MGSKFGSSITVQPTPSVCRKPPPESDPGIPPLWDRILIAWAHYFWNDLSHPIDFQATFNIYPMGPPYQWTGDSKGRPYWFRLDFEAAPEHSTAYVDLKLYEDIVLRGHWVWVNWPLRSLEPFDTGRIYREIPPAGSIIELIVLQ